MSILHMIQDFKDELIKEFIHLSVMLENAEMELSELRQTRRSLLALIRISTFAQEYMLEMEEIIHMGPDKRMFYPSELHTAVVKKYVSLDGISDFEETMEAFPKPFSREFAHDKFDELINESSSTLHNVELEIINAQHTVNFTLREYNKAKVYLEGYN